MPTHFRVLDVQGPAQDPQLVENHASYHESRSMRPEQLRLILSQAVCEVGWIPGPDGGVQCQAAEFRITNTGFFTRLFDFQMCVARPCAPILLGLFAVCSQWGG